MWQMVSATCAIYLAYVLEATGVGANSTGVEPRWLCLAAAWFVWEQSLPRAVLWAGLCGLFAEVVWGLPAGIGVAILGVAVWSAAVIKRGLRCRSAVAFLLLTFLLTVLVVVSLHGVVAFLARPAAVDWQREIVAACGQGGMTTLWAAGMGGVILACRRMSRRILPPLDWRPSPQTGRMVR